jgi:hypothetical protein
MRNLEAETVIEAVKSVLAKSKRREVKESLMAFD